MLDQGEFEKWKAEQALRHGEARLVAQHAALAALEARAISVIGWATTIAVASGRSAATTNGTPGTTLPASAPS